jgi:ABC-2 type transport system ATP-binding protein
MMITKTAAAITATGLRKSYGDQVVLDGIDLDIAAGSIFCLLGPNGAGKTTTVKILSTLTTADAGHVTVAGHDLATDPDGVRAAIGVTGQFSAVDSYLSAEENLRLMADLNHLDRRAGRQRCAELIEQFDLGEYAGKPAAAYSGGMKRRLDLAMTLVGSPRVIFLDEPTTGLDPRVRRSTWQIIRDRVAEGVTIVLTTQYLEEADQLAGRIAVLDHGRLVAEGSPGELKRRVPGGSIVLSFAAVAALDAAARTLGGQAIRSDDDLTLQIPGDGSARSVQTVLNQLDIASVQNLSLRTPELDDVFLALTGQSQPGQSPPSQSQPGKKVQA